MQLPNYNSQIHFFLKSALLICLISCETTEFYPKLNGSEEDEFIGMMLEKMSIEDKVGQMTQLNLGFLSSSLNQHDGKPKQVDWDKVKTAVETYRVGSILNTAGRAYSLARWHEIINGIQEIALEQPLKIPVVYGIDAIHGATYSKGSTLFPHNIGMAATRNLEIVQAAAEVCAAETRASGIRWNFDPVFDVGRQPLWPRFPETFGESALLCGKMGGAIVSTYENFNLAKGQGVAACMKHFIGYGVPASGKDRTEAYISSLELWEHHIPPFQFGVNAGASTLMVNSGSVNGVPVHASRNFLTTLLRERMGFEGVIVSDWQDIIRLHSRHQVARSHRDAVKMAIDAGLDMSMVPNEYSFSEHLVDLVRSGEITEERIDESVRRILEFKMKLGLFSNPKVEETAVKKFGLSEYEDIALQAAEASLVLLENRNEILPLRGDEKLLIVGPTCGSKSALHGSWSYTWQGNVESAYPNETLTIVEAITQVFGTDQVKCPLNGGFDDSLHYKLDIEKAAESSDVIILCLGENAYAESPGVIDDLNLPKNQVKLALDAIATGKPVILVLVEGRGRLVSQFVEDMDAVLLALRPGSQGAMAIARTLSGLSNPSGLLPFTYHRSTGDLIPYDHRFSSKITQGPPGTFTELGFRPQWPFGHGMSYDKLDCEFVDFSCEQCFLGDSVDVNYRLTNKNQDETSKSFDLYLSDDYATHISPRKRVLVAFDHVRVPPRSFIDSTITIPANAFGYVDGEGTWHFEPGSFTVELFGEEKSIILEE